ncbi:FtsX-like permease family protein [Nonomuraea antimicrobica]
MLTLSAGRLPAAAHEVVVTSAFGLRPGEVLRPSGTAPLTVVGVVEHPYRPSLLKVAGLDLPLAPAEEPGPMGEYGTGWLAATTRPVSWADVPELNSAGLYATMPAMLTDRAIYTYLNVQHVVGIGAMVIMVVLETVLLAGPAFAVGLKRRRRELALIAAQGGSPRHLRTIVLADGLVLGGAATLVATPLGIGAGALTAHTLARWGGQVGPLEIPWPPVLAVAALGLLAGVVAALVPAIQAARQDTATVLAGRAPEVTDRPGWPLAGAVLVLAGLGAIVVARRQQDTVWVFAAAVLVLFGLVVLTPWLVRRTGWTAARLWLPLRISVRDAVRHRSRTASAVAAVMAVTATVVAVGIGAYSEYMDRRNAYTSARPTGMLAIWGGNVGDAAWTRLRAEAARQLPGVPLAAGYHARDAQDHRYALRYTVRWNGTRTRRTAAIGDEALLRLLQGRHDPGPPRRWRAARPWCSTRRRCVTANSRCGPARRPAPRARSRCPRCSPPPPTSTRAAPCCRAPWWSRPGSRRWSASSTPCTGCRRTPRCGVIWPRWPPASRSPPRRAIATCPTPACGAGSAALSSSSSAVRWPPPAWPPPTCGRNGRRWRPSAPRPAPCGWSWPGRPSTSPCSAR